MQKWILKPPEIVFQQIHLELETGVPTSVCVREIDLFAVIVILFNSTIQVAHLVHVTAIFMWQDAICVSFYRKAQLDARTFLHQMKLEALTQ